MAALKNKKTSRNKNAVIIEPTARHLWLASLGMLVAVRRESAAAVKRANSKLENAVADTRYAMRRAEADLRASVDGARSQMQPKLVKLSNEVEARLAPIVDKLGLDTFGLKAKRASRKSRKPAAKKPTLRRTSIARKPAKRVAKKVAS